ncbi:hypothetical protein Tco_0268435 [Tanacetum coccineum]
MSSPNHPTSDIEDAFSSNFPDYIPASPDYSPASLGNTYSSSSNNSFGLVPIASPTLSLFHDDPYMKVMHAYYAKILTYSTAKNYFASIFNAISMFNPQGILSVLIANLEQIIEDIQVRRQADKEILLNAIYEHKNSQEGPSDY